MHVELRSKVMSALIPAKLYDIYCTCCLQPAYALGSMNHVQVYKNQVDMLPWTQSLRSILQSISCIMQTSHANT